MSVPEVVSVATAVGVLDAQHTRCQAVIARLSDAQTKVKTWCVSVLAALGGLTALVTSVTAGGLRVAPGVAVAVLGTGVVLVLGFAVLDAYYLWLERGVRADSAGPRDLLAQLLTTGNPATLTEADWRAALTLRSAPRTPGDTWRGVRAAVWSPAVAPFYAGLLVILTIPTGVLSLALALGGA